VFIRVLFPNFQTASNKHGALAQFVLQTIFLLALAQSLAEAKRMIDFFISLSAKAAYLLPT